MGLDCFFEVETENGVSDVAYERNQHDMNRFIYLECKKRGLIDPAHNIESYKAEISLPRAINFLSEAAKDLDYELLNDSMYERISLCRFLCDCIDIHPPLNCFAILDGGFLLQDGHARPQTKTC